MSRVAFSFRRSLEFATKDELAKRMGCAVELWPRATVKELVDNAIDAADEAGVEPEIGILVGSGFIQVDDNGPGLPPETVRQLLDLNLRTSSREAYAAPDRGAQGNALQVLMCLGLADPEQWAEASITSCGVRHDIRLTVDRLKGEIKIEHDETPFERAGCTVRLGCRAPVEADEIQHLVETFAALNPHAGFTFMDHSAGRMIDMEPRERIAKWTPGRPTPPHWYTRERFEHRITMELARNPKITLAQFIGTFAKMSSRTRQAEVAYALDLTAAPLSRLLVEDGTRVDSHLAAELLREMQVAAPAPKPAAMGKIGRSAMEAFAVM